jgi:hypothetical protein
MGQGIRSSLPVLIADELGADPRKILVRQAEGDKKYGRSEHRRLDEHSQAVRQLPQGRRRRAPDADQRRRDQVAGQARRPA